MKTLLASIVLCWKSNSLTLTQTEMFTSISTAHITLDFNFVRIRTPTSGIPPNNTKVINIFSDQSRKKTKNNNNTQFSQRSFLGHSQTCIPILSTKVDLTRLALAKNPSRQASLAEGGRLHGYTDHNHRRQSVSINETSSSNDQLSTTTIGGVFSHKSISLDYRCVLIFSYMSISTTTLYYTSNELSVSHD